jgi:hypothetical protein
MSDSMQTDTASGVGRQCRGCGEFKTEVDFESKGDSHCRACFAGMDTEAVESGKARAEWLTAQHP